MGWRTVLALCWTRCEGNGRGRHPGGRRYSAHQREETSQLKTARLYGRKERPTGMNGELRWENFRTSS